MSYKKGKRGAEGILIWHILEGSPRNLYLSLASSIFQFEQQVENLGADRKSDGFFVVVVERKMR
ncbi:hypothetical protein SLEP1_g28897 [Rubroshorea leprosula]|uniref:Uncharacterized protein n=1 Tax=Rubroshorea leprosula TaxID=152421 RepID=A0AAV5K4K4_9ROSI|nr:hypothetical protein SLEP1_g28897 [Rubroshorea leprosula]